jgi:single-strand DNA-binding protein
MSINHVTVSGNLTRDPEVRTTASGKPVMSLGIAVNDRRRNPETGEWEEFPNFFNCTMFGTRGEQLGELLAKGDQSWIVLPIEAAKPSGLHYGKGKAVPFLS